MRRSEAVLIATLGTQPQVITLAPDNLPGAHEQASEVIVLHTTPDVETGLEMLRDEFVLTCGENPLV